MNNAFGDSEKYINLTLFSTMVPVIDGNFIWSGSRSRRDSIEAIHLVNGIVEHFCPSKMISMPIQFQSIRKSGHNNDEIKR